MGFDSPYMHALKEQSPNIKKRIQRAILELVGERDIGEALDIGTRNPLTEFLEERYSSRIESTDIDLDIGELSGSFDTIFCFEVLEHLFNPLHLLLQIHRVLKTDGRLFISTPKGKPHFLVWEHHFHELYERELRALVKRADFEMVQFRYVRIRPLSKCFGFRPLLRLLLERKTMVELRKIRENSDTDS